MGFTMTFGRKRGRPRQNLPAKDLGTMELRAKRARDLTTEALDLALKREFITPLQHESGERLRCLYTLHFGLPNVTAYNPENHNSRSLRDDDDAWLYARKQDYARCIHELEKARAKPITLNVCVFNYRPLFLTPYKQHVNTAIMHLRQEQLIKLRNGLDALTAVFGKRTSQKEHHTEKRAPT